MDDDRETLHGSDLVLDELREDPVGRDARHLDEEYVRFKNDGESRLSLSGWSVENDDGDRFEFPDRTMLEPGDRVTLHSGSGTDTETELYWGADRPRWRNRGDTVRVRDADGLLRLRESYEG